tara:strand:+ start:618 stop:4505 length:3888 start_codon:yes stop_codon:yes gene_type:complete
VLFGHTDEEHKQVLVADATSGMANPSSDPAAAPAYELSQLTTPPAGLLPVELKFFNDLPVVDSKATEHIMSLIMLENRGRLDPRSECSLLRKVLTEGVARRFIDVERYCRTADGWLGEDEFERADSREAFWNEYGPAIDAFAPDMPFRTARISDVGWREYSVEKGGFELGSAPSRLLSDFNGPDGGPNLKVFQDFDWPERLMKMDKPTARAFRREAREWKEPPKELIVLEIAGIDFERRQISIRLASLQIFDPDLSKTIYEFKVAPAPELVDTAVQALTFPNAVEMDELFEAAVIVGMLQSAASDGDRERLAQALLDRDRLAYRNGQSFEGLPPNHVSRPFFMRQDTRTSDADPQKLRGWAEAFVAGLPSNAERVSQPDLVREGSSISIGAADALGGNSLRGAADAIKRQGWQQSQVRRSTYADEGSILYVLPNQADLYRMAFDLSWFDSLTGSSRRQLARFVVKGVSEISGDDGRPLVVVMLEPLSLSLIVDGRKGRSVGFDGVLDLSEAGTVAAEESGQSGFAPGQPVAFSHELVDMLVAAHAGTGLSPESQYHLLARRWALESGSDNPIGGRFFVRGAPMPNIRDAASIVPQFLAWAGTNAPALPLQVTAEAAGKWPKENSEVTWRIGCYSYRFSGINSFAHQVRLLSTKREIMMDGTGSWTDEQEKSLIFARAVSAAERLILEPQGNCGAPRVSVEFQDALETRLLLSSSMPQPLAGQGISPSQFTMRGSFTLAAVEQLQALPTVDDVLPGDYSIHVDPPRTSGSEKTDVVMLRLEPASVEFFDRDGQPLGGEPGVEVAALSADLQAQLGKIVAPSASGVAYGPDIVGIQLGMSFEEAETIVRQHMEVGRILRGRRAFDDQLRSGQTIPLTSGMLFISSDGRELVALIDEPPAASNRVLAAWRRVYIEPGTVRFDDVAASLRQKLGDPARLEPIREAVRNMWRGPNGNDCTSVYQYGQPQVLASRWTDEGNEPELIAPDGQPMPDAIYPQPLTEPSGPAAATASSCGPFLTTALNFDASRMKAAGYQPSSLDVIDQTLTDIGPYLEAFQASRAALSDQSPAAQRNAFDAPFGPDMIGLRLGMSLQEAEAIVTSRLGARASKFKSVNIADESGVQQTGFAYASEGNREIIALFEDPAAPGRLVSAWRRIYAPAGTDTLAVMKDLQAKYGQPKWRNDEASQYYFTDSGDMTCEIAFSSFFFAPAERLGDRWRAVDGNGHVWEMPDGNSDPYAPRLLAPNADGDALADCGTVFAAALNLSHEGGYIDTGLIDQARMNGLRETGAATAGGASIKF